MMIKKHDTNGTKSLLVEGEFGYDKQGLDRGRVYIGTNTGNTALAKKSEVDSKINSSLAGVSNGIATLGSDGKLTSSQMPTSVLGSLVYDGVWDASTNTPIIQLASALNSGHYYKVSISGSTNIDGISEWNVGDWIISNGVSWDKIDNTDSITSVNGMSGSVVLTKNDIGLGNLTNILDSQRCVLSATKLSTARNINGVPFDGSTDININIATVDAYTKTETNACLALKQANLVSGTNIKTVNGSSILGSGNLSVTTDISSIPFTSIAGLPTTIAEYGVTNVYTKTEVDSRISQKQDTLLSGSNIKTINGQSIVGGGNINLAGGVTSVAGRTGVVVLTKNDVGLDLVTNISDGSRNVLSATKLTTPRNINGIAFDGTSDITINSTDSTKEPIIASGTIAQYYRGDKTWVAMPTSLPASDVYAWAKATTKPSYMYSEISGTPSIPAAQVQSDWNALSGMGVILNKPTLFSGSYTDLSNKPTLFSGSYTDLTNKPTIPSAQVQSDWTAVSGMGVILNKPILFSGSYNDLTNKPTIPTIPTNISYFSNDAGYLTNTYHDSTKQDSLVSGTSIKTINGVSLLGSGDIVISSGGLTKFSESVCNVGTTTGQNILTPNTLCTNADILLMPKGNGSIARVPALNTAITSTRGCYSVDLAIHVLVCRYGSMNLSHYSTSSGGLATVNDKSPYGVVAGGSDNINCNSSAGVISGGINNCICISAFSSISGGTTNYICNSTGASITGGTNNVINASNGAAIKGGSSNLISTSACSIISGGAGSIVCDSVCSNINGGANNRVCTSVSSSVTGGAGNVVCTSSLSNITGGENNTILTSRWNAILGGSTNKLINSKYATILGGYYNTICSASLVDRYALLYGKCGQIGTSDSTTLFALAYGTGALTTGTNSCNLVFCVTNTGITHTKGICALSEFKLTGLPTTNPGAGTGLLWNNAGVLTIA